MLEKSFGLLYYLKQAKNQKNECRYIYLRITVDGNRAELSTKRQRTNDLWNSQLGRAIGDDDSTKELNSYLDLISSKVYNAKIKLMEGNKPVTANNIKNLMIGKDEKKHFIMEAFLRHNIQMKALIGKEVASATLSRYKTAYDHVYCFIRWKYKKDDMEINELNYEFVSQFVFWLKT